MELKSQNIYMLPKRNEKKKAYGKVAYTMI